jgi:hypothetical protein
LVAEKTRHRPFGQRTVVAFGKTPIKMNSAFFASEVAPWLSTPSIGFLINPKNRNAASHSQQVEAAAQALGVPRHCAGR